MNRRSTYRTIRSLWKQHCSEPCPGRLHDKEIDGIDFTSVETYTAGCVQTFVDREGKLDLWRTAILGRCYRDLTVMALKLKGPERAYCHRLEHVANLVLLLVQLSVQKKSAK